MAVADTWDECERELLAAAQGKRAARAEVHLTLLRAARPRWGTAVEAHSGGKTVIFRPLPGGRPSFVLVQAKGWRGTVSSVDLTLHFFPVPGDAGGQERTRCEVPDAPDLLEKMLVGLTTPAAGG